MNYQERLECAIHQDPERCLESPMERSLYNQLKNYNVSPVMQYKVGKYFLDFAFPDLKLGIEYDGDQHMDEEIIGRDADRLDDLNNFGWRVWRVYYWIDHFEAQMRGKDKFIGKDLGEVAAFLAMFVKEYKNKN